MSKDKISDYSATANSNTDIGGINIDEGCAPSGINDAIRTLMKQLKDWQSGSQDVYIHPAGSASVPSITATGDTNTGLFFPAADTVGISTGGTERARVDSSGNLGLGVTPSAWDTFKAFDVNTFGSLFASTGSVQLSGNLYYASSAYKYKTTGAASIYVQTAGQHQWYNAPSGTAGTSATITQAMTLDASGRLGIGTTSPSSVLVLNTASGENTTTYALAGSAKAYVGVAAGSGQIIDGSAANDFCVRSGSNILFSAGGQYEKVRIDSSGNLLVGSTSSPNGKLRVVATADPGGSSFNASFLNQWSGDVSKFGLYIGKYDNNSTTTQRFIGFSINNDATGSGQINANGASQAAFGSFSDARLKENIVDLEPQLEKLMALRPVEFDYIAGGHQTGFVAQEFQNVYPDAVGEADGYLTLTGYGKTEARLIKAIQEQQAIITQLQADVAALKGQA